MKTNQTIVETEKNLEAQSMRADMEIEMEQTRGEDDLADYNQNEANDYRDE